MKLEDLVKAFQDAGLDEESIKAELEKLASEIGDYLKGSCEERQKEEEPPMDEEKEQKRLFGI